MKKLIVIAAVALVAFAANATSIKWSMTTCYESGQASKVISGATVYLLNTADFSQSTILASLRGGKTLSTVVGTGYVLTSTTGSDGKVAAITGATDVYLADSVQSFFAVLVNGDESEVFFSAVAANKTILGTGATTVATLATASKNAAFDGKTAYSAAGWYSTSVPEPTSGLMMLIGVGLMALKRKRA